jgi:hypothetical protein
MRPLTTDLRQGHLRPYFLWDEDVSIDELRLRLHEDEPQRLRFVGKLLREARDIDVWEFLSLQEVADALPKVRHRLGRRRAFWDFLIEGWRDDGLLGR